MSALFTVYSATTGVILRTGCCQANCQHLQCRTEDELILLGVRGDAATQHVEEVEGMPALVSNE